MTENSPHVPEDLAPAAQAAAKAGEYLLSAFRGPETIQRWLKANSEDESSADLKSAEIIAQILASKTPQHGLLFEEGQFSVRTTSEELWVVDSLAGSTNFLRSLPLFAVSIGLIRGASAYGGIVFAPFTGEWYWAVRGAGASYENHFHGIRRAFTRCAPLPIEDSIVAVGAGRATNLRAQGGELMLRLYKKAKTIRRLGTVLELCHVATGGIAAYLNNWMPAWDIAPVIPIIEEAGGTVTSFTGKSIDPRSGGSVLAAGDSEIYRQVKTVLDTL